MNYVQLITISALHSVEWRHVLLWLSDELANTKRQKEELEQQLDVLNKKLALGNLHQNEVGTQSVALD